MIIGVYENAMLENDEISNQVIQGVSERGRGRGRGGDTGRGRGRGQCIGSNAFEIERAIRIIDSQCNISDLTNCGPSGIDLNPPESSRRKGRQNKYRIKGTIEKFIESYKKSREKSMKVEK
jgi:hypothetical protein